MQNCQFDEMDVALRREKVKRIILAKAKGISERHVEQILGAVDFGIQYTITGTADIRIFRRNAIREDGGEAYQVRVTPVYGSFRPGFVNRNGRMVWNTMALSEPAAFIKETSIFDGETTHLQHSIFIYQKRATADPQSPMERR